jgi:hypothetical protein
MLKKQFKSQSQEKILKTKRSLSSKKNLKMLIMKWRLHQLHWKIMMDLIKIKKRLILKRNSTRRLRPLCCSKINPWTHTQLTPLVMLVIQLEKLLTQLMSSKRLNKHLNSHRIKMRAKARLKKDKLMRIKMKMKNN